MISRMKYWFVLAVLPLLVAACSVGHPPQAPGELGRQFAATVPGTWTGGDRSGGIEARMIKQFNADGTAHGVLLMKRNAGGVSMVMPEVPFTSRWRVKGDVVETYDIKTGPKLFKPSEVIRDTILSVSPDRIVSRANDSGRIEVITRLSARR